MHNNSEELSVDNSSGHTRRGVHVYNSSGELSIEHRTVLTYSCVWHDLSREREKVKEREKKRERKRDRERQRKTERDRETQRV